MGELFPELEAERLVLDYAFRCGAIRDLRVGYAASAIRRLVRAGLRDEVVDLILRAYLTDERLAELASSAAAEESATALEVIAPEEETREPAASEAWAHPREEDATIRLTLSFDEAYWGTTRDVAVSHPSAGEETLVRVQVPAGAQNGSVLSCGGVGGRDLLALIEVRDGPTFCLRGADVHVEVAVDERLAAQGGIVLIPNPDGVRLRTRLHAGVRDGQTIRLRGRGAPDRTTPGARGDLYVRMRV